MESVAAANKRIARSDRHRCVVTPAHANRRCPLRSKFPGYERLLMSNLVYS